MFSEFGPEVAELLADVEIVQPHQTYEDADPRPRERTVELREFGGAHTNGDQVVLLPAEGVVFAGDLVENRFFPIVFGDVADAPAWIETLDRLEELGADIVVPGHGEVGGPELIQSLRDYLVEVRDAVAARIGEGRTSRRSPPRWGPRSGRATSPGTTPSGSTSRSATSTGGDRLAGC